MRILYHFPMSVFSRRARLALAHKGLDVELRDARADESLIEEARRLTPIRTMPVLVDEGRVVADSGAIAQYLDRAYPDRPPLWPRDTTLIHEVVAITTAVDVAMNAVVDMGTRDWALRNDPSWPAVLGERMARAQAAIDSVAAKASRDVLVGDSWGIADIWTLSATRWVAGWPLRAKTTPVIAQLVALGFRLPDALVEWAKQHEGRPEVRAVYG